MSDLPDYRREIVIVESVEVDVSVTNPTLDITGTVTVDAIIDTAEIDLVKVGGVAIATPTVTACVPISIENEAIAYDGTNDRFKIDIEKWSATDTINISVQNTTIAVTQSGTWTVAISGTVTITGTIAATQSGTWNITTLTGITNTVNVAIASSVTITVTGTVAISGTVAVTQSGTWTVAVSGTVTITGTVAVSGTVAVTQSGTWTVAISGTVTVSVSGTVTVTGTVAISGTVTVQETISIKGKTPIFKNVTQHDGTTIIYTVTAGKTFYLIGGSLSFVLIAASQNNTAYLEADTGGDGVFIPISVIDATTSALIDKSQLALPLALTVPVPFTAGTVFRIRSVGVSLYVTGCIIGWEE